MTEPVSKRLPSTSPTVGAANEAVNRALKGAVPAPGDQRAQQRGRQASEHFGVAPAGAAGPYRYRL